jgi:prophage tail gpP-like protein
VDTCLSPKYTHINNITVKQLAEQICSALGFRMKFLDDPGPPFEFVINPDNETVGKYLQKFAAQRGLFISCDEHGALVFQKAKSSGEPVAHIEYPGRTATAWSHTYDDTNRFHDYLAWATSADGGKKSSDDTGGVRGAAVDPSVPGARQLVFKVDDTGSNRIDDVAYWTMLRLALQANEVKIPVSTWFDNNGDLWTPNTLVTVKSPVLDVPATRRMVIRGVEFDYSPDEYTAVLSLLPVLVQKDGKLVMEDA